MTLFLLIVLAALLARNQRILNRKLDQIRKELGLLETPDS